MTRPSDSLDLKDICASIPRTDLDSSNVKCTSGNSLLPIKYLCSKWLSEECEMFNLLAKSVTDISTFKPSNATCKVFDEIEWLNFARSEFATKAWN